MVQLSSNYRMSRIRLGGTKSLFPGIALATALAAGCTVWPFQAKERTSIITPGMRVAAVREMAAQADDLDRAEQQRFTEQLAMQIRTEPDPLVRKAIQQTLGEYSTPMAREVLIAGLDDSNLQVRIACCQKLGEKGDPSLIRPSTVWEKSPRPKACPPWELPSKTPIPPCSTPASRLSKRPVDKILATT